MAGSRRATIGEVARLAGCSTATVSRVVNGGAAISAELRASVEETIRRLGYRPSAIGRSLKTRRSRTIGCIIPSLTNPVFASSVSGVETVARDKGWSVLLSATDYEQKREIDVIETLLSRDVEGLILTVTDPDVSLALDLLDRENFPYVLVYNEPRVMKRPAVTVENARSTQKLAEQLIALGHQRIGFVAGRFAASDRSRRRYEGYREAMAAAGLAPLPVIEIDFLATSEEHRRDLVGLLSLAGEPTALMCSNDLLAISIISALRTLGHRIPEDVSVTGFDGIAIGGMLSPALATIDQKPFEMGSQASQRLIASLESDVAITRDVHFIDFEFRPGATLASAPGRNRSTRRAPEVPLSNRQI